MRGRLIEELGTLVMIDTHAHLDAEEFAPDLDDVLKRAGQAGVEAIVCPGTTADSSRAAVALAEAHAEVYAAVGIQPNYTAQAAAGDWEWIVRLAAHPRVVAVGETGLDLYWDFAPLEVQRDYFERHLGLAQDRGLPVVIHCRDAEAEMMPVLRQAARAAPLSGVLHAFSGDRAMAEECLGLGLFVSFAGAVTYTNKKFEPLRVVAAAVPGDRLLIETDSPYLTPHPLRNKQQRNEPANVALVARTLAELRGCTPEDLAAQTTANARRLFRLP
jgi:TatD DNase family protein